MTPIVAMTGGGIKGAVAAARLMTNREVVLLHLDYGQPSAAQEATALAALQSWFPSGRVISLGLSHVGDIQRTSTHSGAPPPPGSEPVREDSVETLPAVARGLMPTLVSAAIQTALRFGATSVVNGLTRWGSADHLGLPDDGTCDRRREFAHAVNYMLDALMKPKVSLSFDTPLLDLSYDDVVKLGVRFGVPFEKTWTCLRGGAVPCTNCEPCKTRARAFIEASIPDPAIAAPVQA